MSKVRLIDANALKKAIAVIGRAVNYNADVLEKLVKRVDELEQTIKKMNENNHED